MHEDNPLAGGQGGGPKTGTPSETYGALVGWKSSDFHDKIILRMQIVTKPPPHAPEDIHQSVVVIDKNQAVQLGHYLYRVSGQTPPRAKPGWLQRFFGK